MRRRRFIRRRVVVDDEAVEDDTSEESGSTFSAYSRRGRSFGGGSMGSRGSRLQTSRTSVGFALAALEEQSSLRALRVDVVSNRRLRP